jgi:hypothetical protein
MGGALVVSGDRLVALWLGESYAAARLVVRLAVAAVALQFLCYTLEGILDADDPRHLRPRAQLLCAAVFVAALGTGALLGASALGVAAAQLAASLAQTALYVRLVARRYGLPRPRELAHGALTVGAAAALAGLLPRALLPPGAAQTVAAVALSGAAALALAAVARAAGVSWPSLLLGERNE